MSKFGEPQECRNNCGGWIYFDRDSKVGHPTQDKWIPLEYSKDAGLKTGQVHQCPKRSSRNGQQQQEQIQQGSTTVVSESTQLKIINAKLDRIINLLFPDAPKAEAEAEDKEQRK